MQTSCSFIYITDHTAALTNTKKEISLTGSVANGDKNEYSVRVGTQMNIGSSKKVAKIQVRLVNKLNPKQFISD